MEKVNNLNKPVWFLNPWFDILILTGFPIAFIFIPLICYAWIHSPKFEYYIYAASNLPHVFAGYTVVYLSQKAYKEKPITFLWIPLFIIIATIIFWQPGYYRQILHIRFSWGMWHAAVQFFYILSFYKLRNLDYLRIDKILDTLALAAGPVYLYLNYYVRFILKPQADTIYDVSLVEQLLKYSVMFTGIIAVAFIARQVYLFIRWKKVYLFKFLMIPIVILIYVVPLLIFKDVYVVSQAVIAMHNVQYVSWVWLYYHQRFKGKAVQENRAISYFFKPGRTGHYIFFFLLAGTLFMLVVMKIAYLSHNPHLTFKAITGPFALIHFYLDGRIWKNVNDMM